MAVCEVTHACEFAAAHRLANPAFTAEQNHRHFGPCAREHGHTYQLEVTVQGPIDPATGMVVDFAALAGVVHEHVVQHVDHHHLDRDVPFLTGVISTAENLAVAFWQRLRSPIGALGCELTAIRLHESGRSGVRYAGPGASG